MRISHFDGNPNPTVATFEIDRDLLGPFGKIVVPRGGKLEQYSPLAQSLFPRSAGIVRVDFAASSGKTYISITRKLVPWKPQEISLALTHLQNFFAGPAPAVLNDAIASNIAVQRAFAPANAIQKLVSQTFHDQVNPILASDGGAMELIGVEIKSTGNISAHVALIGSCHGCGHAETSTLNGATGKIRQVLDVAKRQYASNPDIQKLSFQEITIREVPELVIAKP
jgi:Fe-S cluster biogenesis protein NfuA